MSNAHRAAVAGGVAVLLVLAWLLLRGSDPDLAPAASGANAAANDAASAERAALGAAAAVTAETTSADARAAGTFGGAPTGVRGVVLDGKTGAPLSGIEVVAVKDQPSFEPLLARMRGLFQDGLYVETRAVRRELGRTVSRADGTFELLGLPEGLVFVDGFSDGWFVRTPSSVRLAVGQVREGVELRASPGGRVRGIVLGADGAPAAGAAVSVRPGPNAFLGQLTDRNYRWNETVTARDGRFDLPGVPPGANYTVSVSAPQIALEEVHGVEVRTAQVTELTIRGQIGAIVGGRVVDPQGQPVEGAAIAMVYLDISRVLFSADGRTAPLVTDAEGRFRVEHVASGRVAFVATAPDRAPSRIEELAVVDGGVYEDLVLQLDDGATVAGRVVDDRKQPVAGATVELRPAERPTDPQFLATMLKVRRVEVKTDGDGRFVAKGMSGERLVVQAGKDGYTTAVRFGVRLDGTELVLEIQRGAIVRGKVTAGEQPLARFAVQTRTTPARRPADANAPAGSAGAEPAVATEERDERERGRRGPPWARRGQREGSRQLPEGQKLLDRAFDGLDGDWHEVQAADGSFELRGVPPGRVRVRVRADGCLDSAPQEIELAPGATSDVLAFALDAGIAVAGRVVDDGGRPVGDAQVTAYRQRDGAGGGRGPLNLQIDPEDFDFLGLSAATNRRSALSDSKGAFAIAALEPGRYRFTARHPDLAKASAKEVIVEAGKPVPEVVIELSAGGGIEGQVTGAAMRPLPDAVVVAFSLQTATTRSASTDKAGSYRIDGLPPGQYFVFKSRVDERADNLLYEVLGNLRTKSVTVRQGRFTRLDVHDDSEDGVRVHGNVVENGAPAPRALVTLLGSDREGVLGMGVRANAADANGRYELIGIRPGSYVMQVTRFRGQPVQTTFAVDVPDGTRDFAFDVALPSSSISGRVVDSRGNAVAGIQVTLGSTDGALAGADGLLGLIAQNGLAQARSGADGSFTLRSVAAGTYRVTAGSALGRRRGGGGDGGGRDGGQRHGEGSVDGVAVDGVTAIEGLVVTVPLAGSITGVVLDGSGNPVAGAEIVFAESGAARRRTASNPLLDLVAAQPRPVRSGADGRFAIAGLNPGTYALKVESDALQAGTLDGVAVAEDATADVTLRVVRGATLRVRATNVDKKRIPFAQLSLLDGRGKAVVSRVSTLTVMRRLMADRDTVDDSGWFEFGSVPPDTYTAVLAEPGKPELRIVRTIADGETVAWEIDVAAELAARDRK
jgi:protocatechuate 3,4-dioxygenase beta subunit